MTGFVTIMVLVCQLNVIPSTKGLYCYDKGVVNLRGSLVKGFKEFNYYKCNDRYFKDCSTESKWDGCNFSLVNSGQYYSSTVCP